MWHLEPLAVRIQACVIFTMNVDHQMTAVPTDHHADVRKV